MRLFVAFAALLLAVTAVDGFSVSPNVNVDTRRSTGTSIISTQRQGIISSQDSRTRKVCHASQSRFQPATRLYARSPYSDIIFDEVCDVLVLGSGPAARAIASLLAVQTNVVLADKYLDRAWPPNYGVWEDEWESIVARYGSAGVELAGGNCGTAIDRRWEVTDCFFGGSFDIPTEERTRLERPYLRVDKEALQKTLSTSSYRMIKANHFSEAIAPNVYTPAGSLMHDKEGTTMQLKKADGSVLTVRTKLVVDCTGHETKLVMRDAREPSNGPGFQIAYGALVDVEEADPKSTRIGPYDKEAMTLFDYRTDHFDSKDEATQAKVAKAPTFMYAMPLKNNQVFFEETSLVARPAISFQECKDRFLQRMDHLGIKITKIHEEEFCYIPMGGALPAKDQRVLALGGAAAMVHPSTGYHLCRCMMGASDVARVVLRELAQERPNLDRAAASAYHSVWSPSNVRQRNFAVFGGEFLMKQNVVGLRGFFDGFFRLPLPLWAGFLAGWPGLPSNENHETWYARMWYGLNFIYRLPPSVALDMLGSIISYIAFDNLALAQSVTPFLGEPESYEYKRNKDNRGDVAAKNEARKMIQESKVMVDLPIDFAGMAPEGQASAWADPMPDLSASGVDAKVEASNGFQ